MSRSSSTPPWANPSRRGPRLNILTFRFWLFPWSSAGPPPPPWAGWPAPGAAWPLAGCWGCPFWFWPRPSLRTTAGPLGMGGCPSLVTGRRHVGQTCWRSSQLLRQPKCKVWPQGSFLARLRSTWVLSAGSQGRISSLQMMQVSSRPSSSAVASGYCSMCFRAWRYRMSAWSLLRKDLVVINQSLIM